MYSPNMVICKPCHIHALMYSEKECVGCRKDVIRINMVKFDPHKHSCMLSGAKHITHSDGDIQYICKKCLISKVVCVCCKRHVTERNSLVFSEENYDFSNFVVSACVLDDVQGGNQMYICNSCSKTLCQTSVENPIVPVHMKDKIIRAGALFLKALNDRRECVCTCCHRMLFRKTVRKFKEHDYDFTNDFIRKSLSCQFILKVKQLMNHNVVLSAINSIEELSNKLTDSAEIVFDDYICIWCRNALHSKQPRMPDQACANGLKLFTIPDELKKSFYNRAQVNFSMDTIYNIDCYAKVWWALQNKWTTSECSCNLRLYC